MGALVPGGAVYFSATNDVIVYVVRRFCAYLEVVKLHYAARTNVAVDSAAFCLPGVSGKREEVIKMARQDISPILVGGRWQSATTLNSFQAEGPATGEQLPDVYPVSAWDDVDRALDSAAEAFVRMQSIPPEQIGEFLRSYASAIENRADKICSIASKETGYPVSPRLKDVELPRTTNQLRLAAAATEDPGWRLPVVDTEANICSVLEPLGPTVVFGPNNFPLAFN